MEKNQFDRLIASAKQAVEHAEGKRSDLRTTTLPLPPKTLDKREIAKLARNTEFLSGRVCPASQRLGQDSSVMGTGCRKAVGGDAKASIHDPPPTGDLT